MVSAQRYMERAFIETRPSVVASLLEQAEQDGAAAAQALVAYKANQRNSDRDEQIVQVQALLEQAATVRQQIGNLLEIPSVSNQANGYTVFLNSHAPPFEQADAILAEFSNTAQARAAQQITTASSIITQAYVILIACGVVSILLSVAVSMAIRKSILTPVNEIVAAFEAISKGNMHTQINYESRDEMGRMAKLIKTSSAMQSTIMADIIDKLTKMSQGNLQIEVTQDYPGDFAVLKQTISKTIDNLNNTMRTIINAAEQVSTGSDQVSSGARHSLPALPNRLLLLKNLRLQHRKLLGKPRKMPPTWKLQHNMSQKLEQVSIPVTSTCCS